MKRRRRSKTNVIASSSGRSKSKGHESDDRISDLPDSVLGIILSFLPTKNSVSTSVLSKRWKLVWTTVSNLDLSYPWRERDLWYPTRRLRDERDELRFVEFVNRVVLVNHTGRLNKFRLLWTPQCIASHACSWINTAISRNVHELFLYLYKQGLARYDLPERFTMPTCLFSCNTLRILELCGTVSVSAEIKVCLPKLETLELGSVYFQSEEAFENLIRGCPMLINLKIIDPQVLLCDFIPDEFRYIISSTSLTHLELCVDERHDLPVFIDLELETSSLEYFTIDDDHRLIPVFHGKSLSSLVEVKFNLDLGLHVDDTETCDSVVKAVRVFDCAKALILSAQVILALSFATVTLSTEFKRLVKLEVETYCCATTSLRDLIECSDNLEVLIVKQDNTGLDEDDLDHDHTHWKPPVQVPRCLSNSLKKFVVDGYYGLRDEHEMICYMLNHGRALEVMEISCCKTPSKGAKLDLVKEICNFSRKSSSKFPDCEFKFAGKTSKCNIKLL